jgi:hypothetical protein
LRTQTIARDRTGRAGFALSVVNNWTKSFSGQSQRPYLEAIVASGLFEECAGSIASLADTDDALGDVNHFALYMALKILITCRHLPGAEARIRSLAPALARCLQHDLDVVEQLGVTTGSSTAQICEALHGPSTVYRCAMPLY